MVVESEIIIGCPDILLDILDAHGDVLEDHNIFDIDYAKKEFYIYNDGDSLTTDTYSLTVRAYYDGLRNYAYHDFTVD